MSDRLPGDIAWSDDARRQEPSPPPATDVGDLPASDEPAPAAPEPAYEQRLDAFEANVDDLHDRYEPFLESHVPEGPDTVDRRGLTAFDFRRETDADRADFERVTSGAGEWESVEIPDYRGPVGWWTGFYRTTFDHDGTPADRRSYLVFEGADYEATVYLNGRCLGAHEGFFAPFEFDATDALREGENVLVVEIENRAPMRQLSKWQGEAVDGKKLYGLTGPGWDDPELGWHHCPPGAGLHRPVRLEERPVVHLGEPFVRPDLDGDRVQVRQPVENARHEYRDVSLSCEIFPQNFEGESVDGGERDVEPAGPGENEYRFAVDMDEYRTWDTEAPWLYTARVQLHVDGEVVDSRDATVGMRSFEQRTDEEPRGELELNGDPVRLRGVNTMAHLSRAAMAGDDEQIVRDLLILKNANCNLVRFTQRPVPRRVYELCDRLGMCAQTDFPLHNWLPRGQFTEAVDQAREMERHVRGHPSSVIVSLINEPKSATEEGRTHRHYERDELERFFEAASQAIRTENPDRVVKHAEGDYSPPTLAGMDDRHIYALWYANHGLSVGRIHANELPSLREGWMTGIGEYGAEALDTPAATERWPEEWKPAHPDEEWYPSVVSEAQMHRIHGFWHEEVDTLEAWRRESQRHQARTARLQTDAIRRRADRVAMSAIHLGIDAWPAGWMKAIVDVTRTPKPAYFAYKDALEPRRAHLRTDRDRVYGGEETGVEAWALNDGDALEGWELRATVRVDGAERESYATTVDVDAAAAKPIGTVPVSVPEVDERTTVAVDAALVDPEREVAHAERLELEAFPRPEPSISATYLGEDVPERLDGAGLDLAPYEPGAAFDVLLVGEPEAFDAHREAVLDRVAAGARLVCLRRGEGAWDLGEATVEVGDIWTIDENGLTFFARDPDHPATADLRADDLGFLYDADSDRIDFSGSTYLDGDLEPVVFTYDGNWATDLETRADEDEGAKGRVPIVGERSLGEGTVVCSEFVVEGRTGCVPTVDHLLRGLVDGA